jgi:hypothetical protein
MKKLQLRMFNQNGIDEFVRRLDSMASGGHILPLEDLIIDPELTSDVPGNCEVIVRDFKDRMGYGKYFFDLLTQVEGELQAAKIRIIGNRGLWSWFAAAWFEHLARDSKNRFFIGHYERYILSPMTIKDYRHLIYGPCLVYTAGQGNPDLIQAFMRDHVTEFSNFFEQVASRREILNNPNALEVINRCYVDARTRAPIKASVQKQIPGGIERFGSLYSQLAVNYDLFAMSSDEIAALLPAEFTPWLNGLRK